MPESRNLQELDNLGYTLHQLLLDGDVTAPARIAEAFMAPVLARLRARYPHLPDSDLVDTAVEDAFVNYLSHPEQYDPGRGSLAAYLRMAANGDLLNLLKRNRKEMSDLSSGRIVELDNQDAEHEVDIADDFNLEAFILDQNSPVWDWLPGLVPDPVDQELLFLLLEGVRETKAYAQVLGLTGYPVEEQAAQVKRHKDRLKKRLQRNIDRSQLSEYD